MRLATGAPPLHDHCVSVLAHIGPMPVEELGMLAPAGALAVGVGLAHLRSLGTDLRDRLARCRSRRP